jgi:hypothetical protein
VITNYADGDNKISINIDDSNLAQKPISRLPNSRSEDRLMAIRAKLQVAATTPSPPITDTDDVPFSPLKNPPPHMKSTNSNTDKSLTHRNSAISTNGNSHSTLSDTPLPAMDNPPQTSFFSCCWSSCFSTFFQQSEVKKVDSELQLSVVNENKEGTLPENGIPSASSY